MTYEEAKDALDRIKEINEELTKPEICDAHVFVNIVVHEIRTPPTLGIAVEHLEIAERVAPGLVDNLRKIDRLRSERQKLFEEISRLARSI
jgi:hypothetical protein